MTLFIFIMSEYMLIIVIYFFLFVFCLSQLCYCCKQLCCEIELEDKLPEATAVERTESMESVNVVIEITENNIAYG
tara:strand:+ start:7492 stop:7719 length:228 start_codon:yes stop_codon:yes gene_type:complete